MINEHASNLRRMSAQAHEWGDQNWADELRQAANELDRLTRGRDHLLEIREQLVGQRDWASQQIDRLARERDKARAEVKRLRGLLLKHAAELVRRQYTAHTEDVADQIRANRAIIHLALVRDADAQRRAGIALRDAMKAGQ